MKLVKKIIEVSSGVSLESLETGTDGDVIVLVPGWTMSSEVWPELIDDLGKNFRAISLTMRSHPGSTVTQEGNTLHQYAQDIHAFLKKRNISKCHLLGWSMGVSIVFEYIKSFGDIDLNSIILVDGSRFGTKSNDWPFGTDSEKYSEFSKQIKVDRRKFTHTFVESMFNEKQPSEYIESISNLAEKVPADVAISLLNQILDVDYRDIIPNITCRTLIAVCEKNKDAAQWAHERMANSQLEVFDKEGHAIFRDARDRFNKILKEFIIN